MNSFRHVEDFLNDKSFRDWVLKNSSDQAMRWKIWQMENPGRREMMLQAKMILLEMDSPTQEWTDKRQAKIFSKIHKQINSNEKLLSNAGFSSSVILIPRKFMAVLVFFLFLVSALVVYKMNILDSDQDQLQVLEVVEKEWIAKSNPRGQKSTIHLPDGSTLMLNSESEIRYQKDFGTVHRDLFLEGESFFEVVSSNPLPFRVFAGDLVTIALGTSFNINSFNHESVQVQLATGKVQVYQEKRTDQTLFLSPGEEAVLGTDQELNKKNFNLNNAFHWKDGILIFEQTPINEVINSMERWYAVKIEVVNPVNNLKISGEFNNTYLSDVLESLGYAYGFEYNINNKEVIITFTHSESS